MYDKLVKRLRNAAHWADKGLVIDPSVCFEAAYAIEELQGKAKVLEKLADKWCEAVPKWIPVTERLPEDLTRVIVFCEDGVSYGLCEHSIADDEEIIEWHDFLYYPITPTHWMPLPEPPKEERA